MTIDDLFTQAPPEPQSPPPRSHRRRTLILLGLVLALLGLLGAVFAWYLTTRKPLSQLPGLSRSATPHYLFSIYGTAQPLGVAVSPDGERVYVTDSGGSRLVHVYRRSGEKAGTLQPPASTGPSHVPVYVAVNPVNGEVYVSDRFTASVYVYGPGNEFRRTFVPRGDTDGGWAPLGLAFDRQGRLIVTDVRAKGGHRVLVFAADGTLERAITPTGGLSFPNGVVVDSRGDIEVCDSNNSRVLMFRADGSTLGRLVSGGGDEALGLPRGITVDDQDRLYVVDAANHGVRIYHLGSARTDVPRYLGSFGTEGTLDGAFEFPNGVAADSRARIYITDRENSRLQVWGY